MRSNPVLALIALLVAGFMIKLTFGILSESRGETLVQYAVVFAALVFVFKMIGLLTFWAIVCAAIAFPLALLAYLHLTEGSSTPPKS